MNVRSVAMPTRPLCPKNGEKPLKYVPKDKTNIRNTFEKARRFISRGHYNVNQSGLFLSIAGTQEEAQV